MPGDLFSSRPDPRYAVSHRHARLDRALGEHQDHARHGRARPGKHSLANYFVNLSSNVNYAQNSLAAAEFDGPYPFAGGHSALQRCTFATTRSTDCTFVRAALRHRHLLRHRIDQPDDPAAAAVQPDRLRSVHPVAEGRILIQESAFQSGSRSRFRQAP